MQPRKRPQLVTTIDPAMDALLRQVANEDSRPLSFVVDQALHTWAKLQRDDVDASETSAA